MIRRCFASLQGLTSAKTPSPTREPPLRWLHWLEAHDLASQILVMGNALPTAQVLPSKHGTVVAATQIAPPSSTKNSATKPNPEWVSGNELELRTNKKNNPWQFARCAHPSLRSGQLCGYPAAPAVPRGTKARLGKYTGLGLMHMEKTKASIRAKVVPPFWVIKQQLGYVKVRYQGQAKNIANLTTLFALSTLRMVCKRLLTIRAQG